MRWVGYFRVKGDSECGGNRGYAYRDIPVSTAACGDLDGTIRPVLRCSSMNALHVSCSFGLRGYTLAIFGTNEGLRSMVWS